MPAAATAIATVPGYQPIPVPPKRGPRPSTNTEYASAFATVLLQVLTDAFDLHDTEHMWVGYHLDRILEPLRSSTPHAIPVPVRQELNDGTYSRLLELRHRARALRGQAAFNPAVLHATRDEWATALLAPVFHSYRLRPMTESSMNGALVGMLAELGVGDPRNPRGSLYLPADLRLLVLDR